MGDVIKYVFIQNICVEKTIKATLESIQPILVQKYIRNITKNEQDIFGLSFPNFKNCIQGVDVCSQSIQKSSGSYNSKKKIVEYIMHRVSKWNASYP